MKTQNQTYKPLAVGDIRQLGDQRSPKPGAYGSGNWSDEPEGMIGHTILPGDLILNSYRRPL